MAGAPITYVRHAMPVVEEGVDSARWHLDEGSRHHARAWADRLEVGEGIAVLVSSTEPKALETAAAIADRWPAEVRGDDRLREATRPWIGTGYRAMAHGYLRGEQHEGWEPQEAVAARFAAAVHDAQGVAAGGPVVVVTHGLALAMHLGDRLGPDFDRESFWSRLAFPDAWVLDGDVLHRSLPVAT
jgi:broad specificity phosphatase PhoE